MLSTLLFGLMHLPNWHFGAGPGATAQVGPAFMGGSMLYLTRRVSGTLVLAMLVHGFWDFASFIGTGGGAVAPLVRSATASWPCAWSSSCCAARRACGPQQVGVDAPEAAAAAVTWGLPVRRPAGAPGR